MAEVCRWLYPEANFEMLVTFSWCGWNTPGYNSSAITVAVPIFTWQSVTVMRQPRPRVTVWCGAALYLNYITAYSKLTMERPQLANFTHGIPPINFLSCVKLQISYLGLTMKANFCHLILNVDNFYRICAVLVFLCDTRYWFQVLFQVLFKTFLLMSQNLFEMILLVHSIKQFDCN